MRRHVGFSLIFVCVDFVSGNLGICLKQAFNLYDNAPRALEIMSVQILIYGFEELQLHGYKVARLFFILDLIRHSSIVKGYLE